MAVASDPRRDPGVAARVHADEEERGPDVLALEDVENRLGEGTVGAVVERQRHDALPAGSLPVGLPERVRPGREGVVAPQPQEQREERNDGAGSRDSPAGAPPDPED